MLAFLLLLLLKPIQQRGIHQSARGRLQPAKAIRKSASRLDGFGCVVMRRVVQTELVTATVIQEGME